MEDTMITNLTSIPDNLLGNLVFVACRQEISEESTSKYLAKIDLA